MSKVENESIVLEKESSGIANKILDLFERVGNKLPDNDKCIPNLSTSWSCFSCHDWNWCC